MKTVITYGTYDMLHYGHIRLLERARSLGDYLIVGVTSDDFDKARGKINTQQTLVERIEGVRGTGLADRIIVEEYEGQKIDDIKRYCIDVFAVGDDWEGQFDYLKDYCKVIYLPRTKGVSSSEIRSSKRSVRLGFAGSSEGRILDKYCTEAKYVDGAEVAALFTTDKDVLSAHSDVTGVDSFDRLLNHCDAVYIVTHPTKHQEQIECAIRRGKHVLVEMPIALDVEGCQRLHRLADEAGVMLMPAMKTAYSTAYNRLQLLLKSGAIGKVMSVDATCTSIRNPKAEGRPYSSMWNSICAWGPTAMLPIFQLLGTNYKSASIATAIVDRESRFDAFTKIDLLFDSAAASLRVGRGVKAEGELVVAGTEGYIYVPAPWWKTEYFEVRREDPSENRRYYYHLEGEGIRNELVEFVKAVDTGIDPGFIGCDVSEAIHSVIGMYYSGNVDEIGLG